MESEQLAEWQSLEKSAIKSVRLGQGELSLSTRRLFQIIVSRSFTPVVGWEIFKANQRSQTVEHTAVRTIWPRNDDWQKFEESWKFKIPIHRLKRQPITPIINTQQIPLEEEFVVEATSSLQSISIPPL